MKMMNVLLGLGAAALFASSVSAAPSVEFTYVTTTGGFDIYEGTTTDLDSAIALDATFTNVNIGTLFDGPYLFEELGFVGQGPTETYFYMPGQGSSIKMGDYDVPNSGVGDFKIAFAREGGVTLPSPALMQVAVPTGQVATYSIRFAAAEGVDLGTYSGLIPIPEPASLALLGLGGLALIRRR